MARTILILGGVRSGKSRFAQQLATRLGGDNVLFIATAEAGDEEMSQRIAMHRRSRPATWATLEQTRDIGAALDAVTESHAAVLIDCLTLLVSNLLLANENQDFAKVQRIIDTEIEELLNCLSRRKGTAIIVSGEVGLGLVPDNALGRMYRDLLGWANQRIAQHAESVYLMMAGFAIEIKSLATTVERAAQLGTNEEINTEAQN